MKKIILFSVICLVAFIAASCKKEDENQGASKNTHRIKEMLDISSYEQIKTVYTYTGEKISQSIEYSGYKSSQENWSESHKNEYIYENNKITQTRFEYSGGSWIPVNQYLNSFSGDKLTENMVSIFQNNEWIPDYKRTFLYSGDKLVKEEYFQSEGNGVWTLEDKREYTYANNLCSEVLYYSNYPSGNLELIFKATFSYSGGKLSEIIWHSKYYGTWENDFKDVYNYSENRLANIQGYEWDNYNGRWSTEAEWSESFEYDANGYLTRQLSTGYSYNQTTTYTYEAGNGNGQMLLNDPGYLVYGYPVIRKPGAGLHSDVLLDPSFR
jgi:nuclear transport factor 2 (NTF2) superfamily protein